MRRLFGVSFSSNTMPATSPTSMPSLANTGAPISSAAISAASGSTLAGSAEASGVRHKKSAAKAIAGNLLAIARSPARHQRRGYLLVPRPHTSRLGHGTSSDEPLL